LTSSLESAHTGPRATRWERRLGLFGTVVTFLVALLLFGYSYRTGTAFLVGVALVSALAWGFGSRRRGQVRWAPAIGLVGVLALAFLFLYSRIRPDGLPVHAPWNPTAVAIIPSADVPADSLSLLRGLAEEEGADLAHRTTFLPEFQGALALEPVSPSHLTVTTASGNELPTGPTSRYVVQSKSAGPTDVRAILVRANGSWILFSGQVRRIGDSVVVRALKPPRVIGGGKGVEGYRVTLTTRVDQVSFSDTTEVVLPDTRLVFVDSLIPSRPEGLFIRKIETRPLRAATDGSINARLGDGSQILGNLCGSECPPTHVTVHGLVRYSFVEADSDDSASVRGLSDRERARWEVRNARAGVNFTITKPGWRWVTRIPVSGRFINAKGVGELFLVAVLGGVLSLGWLIGPLKRLLGWLRSRGASRSTAV
jgi:hypothetical protein